MCCVDRVDVDSAPRRAWLSAMRAHVRAGAKHGEAAVVQARSGHPELERLALARAARQREGYDAALGQHPEWAGDAPDWPRGRDS